MSVIQGPDPAIQLLISLGTPSVPTVHNENCYICNDPEFAAAGLPLCYPCKLCGEHVPADDCVCDNGHDQMVLHIYNKIFADVLEDMSV
jgi:hypothetical protein